jgi:sucrose-6-phosphate hydrolase SacC (GH32 family)
VSHIFDFEEEETIKMEVLLDRSSVEAYFFGGLYSMTNLALGDDKCNGVVLFIDDYDNAYVDTLRVTVLQRTTP